MKRKVIGTILTVAIVLCLVFAFVCCENQTQQDKVSNEIFMIILYVVIGIIGLAAIIAAFTANGRAKRLERRFNEQEVVDDVENIKRYHELLEKLAIEQDEWERSVIQDEIDTIKQDSYLVTTVEKRFAQAEKRLLELEKELKEKK